MLESLTRSGPLIRSPTTQEDAIKAAARGSSPSAGPPGKRPREMNEFPKKFGQYVLLKPLARGGMGALYLALSGPEDTAKLCVIKTVLPHLADKEYLQRFRDEAKVVVRLSHGNLVPVFDSGQAGGEIYLAMDYVEGQGPARDLEPLRQEGDRVPRRCRGAHRPRDGARPLLRAHTSATSSWSTGTSRRPTCCCRTAARCG